MTKATYVMANRRAGKFTESAKSTARAAMDSSFSRHFAANSDIVSDQAPPAESARRIVVFQADAGEVAAKRVLLPSDVILERQILHYPQIRTFFGFSLEAGVLSSIDPGFGRSIQLIVQCQSAGQPKALAGCPVQMFFRGPTPNLNTRVLRFSKPDGTVEFEHSGAFDPAVAVAEPVDGFWPMILRAPVDGALIVCPELPATGPLAWWHQSVGIAKFTKSRGTGIKIGVVDTGFDYRHPALAHVIDAGAFAGGGHVTVPHAADDVDRHGTHVCGIIGAKPQNPDEFAGIAPGAALFCARVFASGKEGADQADISGAIEELSKNRGVDLINLSLGASIPSEIERDVIKDALERGTLCFCAAGNSAGAVQYPAAFPETAAISALGLLHWGPDGSVSANRIPEGAEHFGAENLYLANFSCFGTEIECSAPGVGIISTVPLSPDSKVSYAPMDGTSMASPLACAVLAGLLSRDQTYATLPRNEARAAHARALLKQHCRDLRLAEPFQGRGLVSL